MRTGAINATGVKQALFPYDLQKRASPIRFQCELEVEIPSI